jgi:hypothetical protein
VARNAEPDIQSARKIFEKATKVNFRTVEDLAEVWCEWAEMEIRAEYEPLSIYVNMTNVAIGTTTRRFESCNAGPQFRRTQRSTTMTRQVKK